MIRRDDTGTLSLPWSLSTRRLAALLLGAAVAGCGGGSSNSTPTQPTSSGGGSTAAATFTIMATGVSPKEVTITPGSRVRFVNNDSATHDMSSDPHPDHSNCPEINQVGFLQPSQTKETGNFVSPKTCGFHDHQQPTNASLQGRIIVR